MGLTASIPTTQPPPSSASASRASLISTHDISPSDLATAYGTDVNTPNNGIKPNGTPTSILPFDPTTFTDTPNAGLTPSSTNKAGKYISLDCEMVGTGEPPYYTTNILARVSIVNYHGAQLYDSYVIPPPGIPIHDYRTKYSGILPHHLLASNGARSFNTVQRDVASLLEGRCLVGHALRNDLRVLQLKIQAGFLRDTASYTVFRKLAGGKAPALKVLAERELGWRIQGGEMGHSSLEDARAAMLVFRKVRVGLEAEMRGWVGGLRGGKGDRDKGRLGGEGARFGVDGGGGDQEDESIVDGDLDEDALEDEEIDSEIEEAAGARRVNGSAGGGATSTQTTKKKRKKKKRTKRK